MTFLMLVFLYFFGRSIKIAIGAIKSAAIFIDDNMEIFVVPLIHLCVVILYLAIWAYGIVHLLSLGE